MAFVKRALLSITHSWRNNILLILLFTIIATLILSGLCIQSATAAESAAIRRNLGGEVILNPVNDGNGGFKKFSYDTISKIASLRHVQSSNFISTATVKPDGFELADGMDSATVMGLTDTKKYDDFAKGSNNLTSGRHLSAGDKNKPYVIIEKSLADQNKIKLNDTISVKSDKGKTAKLSVIGIFKSTDPSAKGLMLVPYTMVRALTGSTDLNYAVYYIDDPINIDSFKGAVSRLSLASVKASQLDAQDDTYTRLAAPIANTNLIASIMVLGVIIAGAIVLSLMVVLNQKGRKYEIGILLAIGEHKARVIAQMALEILVPVLIACSLSFAVGNYAAQQIGKIMFSTQQQSTTDEIQDQSTGRLYSQAGNMSVSIKANDIAELYLSGIVLALLSSAIPLVSVMRYNPKDILVQIE